MKDSRKQKEYKVMITREKLIYFEKLAGLSFSDKERNDFIQKLEIIIKMIDQIWEVKC